MSYSDAAHGDNYLNHEKGLWSWMTTIDHKRIGLMYLASVCFFFFLGGIFALIIRLNLMHSGHPVVEAKTYNQLMTYHGAIMVFLVIIPAIPASIGNFVLPMMLGAKDVAFPKLNLASYYIYLLGAILACLALFLGGADTGWTFYTPYSIRTSGAVIWVIGGAFVAGFSSILTGLNFIVTIQKLRAPGLTWNRLPLLLWALYATSVIQVLATPVLAITLLLLIAERTFKIGIFDPALGGDPILFQHFFWFYSHPAVYIMILPAMGVISEIIPVFSRKPIFGYKAIAYSTIAIGLLAFLVWAHHMFTSGVQPWLEVYFMIATMIIAVPTGIKVFSWVATLFEGKLRLDSPLLFALGFVSVFTLGGITGIMLASVPVDLHEHGTYFLVAHLHYVLFGGSVFAIFAGLYYYWPKMTGRMLDERLSRLHFWLMYVSFNTTFFPMHIIGLLGMPRRVADYDPQFGPWNLFISLSAFVLGASFLVFMYNAAWSLARGERAPANPWGARTLEWATNSPPGHGNFVETPVVVHGPYDFTKPAQYYGPLADAPASWRPEDNSSEGDTDERH